MIAAIALFFILLALLQVPIPGASISIKSQQAAVVADRVQSSKAVFTPVEILAKGALVVTFPDGQRIFEKNSDEPMALASLVKLMTALAVKEAIPNSAITFGVSISEEDVLVEGDSGFLVGEEYAAGALLDAMLVGSSNDAAHALARASMFYLAENGASPEFIGVLNNRARKIGLSRVSFFNESGLDVSETRSGGYGSASDIAKLVIYILKNFPGLLDSTRLPDIRIESLAGRKLIVQNSNILAKLLPGLLLSKTGFTDIAGGNLVIAADVGFQNPVIIVVLGSTEQGRFEDVLKLHDAAKIFYQQ